MKKFSVFVTAIILVIFCAILLPTDAHAASQSDLTFTLQTSGNAYTVTRCKTSASGSLTIPSTYNGKPVTVIQSNAFQQCANITSITIPDSITSIGMRAFDRCTRLSSVTINARITTIRANTFFECTSLQSISIPSSVKTIEESAFNGCSALKSVTIPYGVTEIGNSAFYNCISLTSVKIPNSVTSIGNSAFSSDTYVDASKLQTVSLGTGIKTIGDYAFQYSENLTSITIPNSATSIGSYAFAGCRGLKTLTIGQGVTSIGNSAFEGCLYLEEIHYNAVSVADLQTGNRAFRLAGKAGTGITVQIGSSVKRIPAYLFYPDTVTNSYVDGYNYPPLIKYIEFPSYTQCTHIGTRAFAELDNLSSFPFPSTIKTTGAGIFYGCDKLERIDITSLVSWCEMEMESSLFGGRPSFYAYSLYLNGVQIKDLVIPSGVSCVDNFQYTSLSTATIPEGVTEIGDGAFAGSLVRIIYLPTSITKIGDMALDTYHPKKIYISDINAWCNITWVEDYNSYNDTWYFAPVLDDAEIYLNGVLLTDAVVTGNVRDHAFDSYELLKTIKVIGNASGIGKEAFSYCTGLTSITLGDGVSDIGISAFWGCTGLKTINIPGSVNSIGDSAFRGCSGLTSVTIGDGVMSIGAEAFMNCSNITSIRIGNGLTFVGDRVFSNCSMLQSMAFPSGMVSLGEYVFDGCSSLTAVSIPNTVVEFGDYMFKNCTSLCNVSVPNAAAISAKGTFYGCGALPSIKIPQGVTFIGQQVCYNCDSLQRVEFPDSVTAVSAEAFYSCSNLESVSFGTGIREIGSSAFSKIKKVEINDLKAWCSVILRSSKPTDGAALYVNGELVEKLIIPEGVETISTCAFYGCSSIKEVEISDCVKAIGDYAFTNCTALREVTFGNGFQQLGDYVFSQCSALKEIEFFGDAPSIRSAAFYNVVATAYYPGTNPTWTESVRQNYGGKITWVCACVHEWQPANCYAPQTCSLCGKTWGIKTEHHFVDDCCIYCGDIGGYFGENLLWILDRDGVLNISGFGAMPNYTSTWEASQYLPPWEPHKESIKEIVIADGITHIGMFSFLECTEVSRVTIPNSVTGIGLGAFVHLDNLAEIHITDIESWCNIDFETNYSNPLSIGAGLYLNNELVSDLKLSEGITRINKFAFFYYTCLTSVVIPESVTCIEDEAFSYCTNLQSVTIENGVTTVGNRVFSQCSNLRNVSVGRGVTTIGESAFEGCTAMQNIVLPQSVTEIGEYAFYGCTSLETVNIPEGITSIESYTFYDCSSLKSIVIPETVSDIGGSAFGSCTSLTNVVVPDSVTSFGGRVFEYCGNLQSITLSNQIAIIKASTFIGCTSLTSLIIPDSVTIIEESAFYDCKSLQSIAVPDNVNAIGDRAFSGCSALHSVTIGKGVAEIFYGAFYDCLSIENVYIKDIAAWCNIDFYDSYSNPIRYAKNLYVNGEKVSNLVIPEGTTCIKSNAFYWADFLTRVTIPDSVTSIGAYAFSSCNKLHKITVGTGLVNVGREAFNGCYNIDEVWISDVAAWCSIQFYDFASNPLIYANNLYLNEELVKQLIIPGNVRRIERYVFYGCSSITSITIPSSLAEIGFEAFEGCNNLSAVYIFDIGAWCNIKFSCNPLTYAHNLYLNGSLVTDIIVPDNIGIIGANTFNGCTSLEKVTIPGTVKRIGSSAFMSCSSLTNVSIGNGVTRIENAAFYDCSSLTSVTIPESVIWIEDYSVWGGVFSRCSSLSGIWVDPNNKQYSSDSYGVLFNKDKTVLIKAPGGLSNAYAIPESVFKIEANAFSDCTALRSVMIPNSITSIGVEAFARCGNLTDFFYLGTEVEKDGISFGSGYDFLTEATWHYLVEQATETGVRYLVCTDCDYKTIVALKSLSLIAAPSNQSCFVNGSVVLDGISLQGQYDDGEVCILDASYIDGVTAELSTTGKVTATVTFAGVSATFDVFVHEAIITSSGMEMLHPSVVTIQRTEPTCTESGLTEKCCCEICGITLKEQTVIDVLPHDGQWMILAPGCTEVGMKACICDACGQTVTEEIPASGHSYNTVVIPPTCIEEGYTAIICSQCLDQQIIDPVSPLGHSFVESDTVAPTCTKTGYTIQICTVCGREEKTNYVPAKGHSWSAWITTVKASCTKEGSKLRFCNCGTRETESVAKLPHSIADGVCTTCNTAMSGYVLLTADMNLTGLGLAEDLYVDLNGYDLSGTIITNGFKVYGMDSSTDGYTCGNMGVFSCVDENGDPIVPVRQFKSDISGEIKRFMAIETENGYTFHRFYLGITKVSLRTGDTGFGYKAVFNGDEMVLSNIASFGFKLNLEGNETVIVKSLDASRLEMGREYSLLLKNFDIAKFGETDVNAEVFLKLKGDFEVTSSSVSYSMKTMLHKVSQSLTSFTEGQIIALRTMCQPYADIMKNWGIDALVNDKL